MNTVGKLSKYPVLKRLSIAVPIAASIEMIRSWLGFEQSALLGLVSGIAALFIADCVLASAVERKQRAQDSFRYIRNNILVVANSCLLISAIMFFIGTTEQSTDPQISAIQAMVGTFFLIAILSLFMFGVFKGMVLSGSYLFSGYSFGRLLSGVAAYYAVLWLLGKYGIEAKAWITSNPNEAAAVAISTLLVWSVLKYTLAPVYADKSDTRRGMSGAYSADMNVTPKATERDNKYIAAHETGHAMVYAALGCLPPGTEVAIKKDASIGGSIGYVTGINSNHLLDEKTFSEWLMLVLLAGKMGEAVAYGENTMGSTSDHQRWLGLARGYLSNHFKGIFYLNPENKFEQQLNEEKLDWLQHQQRSILEELFQSNSDVFKSLSEALLAQKKLDRNALIPFLSRVKLPEGFPFPLGRFDSFKSDWPSDVGLYTNNR